MKDDKLSFKSNAKVKNFSVDDIGKLSINDVKELKNIFQPKRRAPKKEESNFKLSRDKIPKDILDQIKSSSDHMKGFQETKNNFIGGGGGSSIPSGLVGGRFNQPVLTYDGGADRFANKSNLDDSKIKDIVNNSMNPLLDDFRKTAQDQFIQNNRHFFQGMGAIKDRYIDFENSINEKYNKLIREQTPSFNNNMTKLNNDDVDDDYNKENNNNKNDNNLNSLLYDDSGNNSETKGSDNFVSNKSKNNDGYLKNGDEEVMNDLEKIENENMKRENLKQQYSKLGGSDKNVLESNDIRFIDDKVNELVNKQFNDIMSDINNDDYNFMDDDNTSSAVTKNIQKNLKSIRSQLKNEYKDLGGTDKEVLKSDDIGIITNAINELKSKYSPDYNNESYFTIEDVEEDEEEEEDDKEYNDFLKQLKTKYKTLGGNDENILKELNANKIEDAIKEQQKQHKKSELYKKYMGNNINLQELKTYYKSLGGNDDKILNAKGPGSTNIVIGAISTILKSAGIDEKRLTKDSKTKQIIFDE